MNKTVKKLISLLLCILMLMPIAGMMATAALGRVTNLKLKTNYGIKQSITWSAVSGASGYAVYTYSRSAEKYVRLGYTTKTSYSINNLTTATTYYYKVRAYKNVGSSKTYGSYSQVLVANTIGKTYGLKLYDNTASTQTLMWNTVTGATGYTVYIKNGSKWVKLGTTKSTSYKVSGLSASADYTYRVAAYKTKNGVTNNGPYSAQIMRTTRPAKVKSLAVMSAGTSSVTLTWAKSAGVTGYCVYMYNANGSKTLLTTTSANSYTVKNLANLKSYSFTVRAYTDRCNKVYGYYSDKLTTSTKPAKVSGIVAETTADDAISFAWDGVSKAYGYEVYRYNYTTEKWTLVQTSRLPVYSIKNLLPGSKVRIKVRAYVNVDGSAVYGSFSDPFLAATAPATPKNLVAALNSNKGISLSWSPVAGAGGYRIFRYDPHDGEWDLIGISLKTRFNNNNLTETREYMYKIQAYIAGTGKVYYSDYSNHAEVSYENPDGTTDSNLEDILDKISDSPFSDEDSQLLQKGFLSYLYDPVDNYYYTASDPWQRDLGYSVVYDVAAPFTIMWYDTMRLKFNYNNLDWMIQVWKGQYGWIFKGAEIGVYTKPPTRVGDAVFYDCASDENSLNMSFDFYYDNKLKFTRPYGTYWWCTGFIPGANYVNHDRITIDIRITMEDFDMLDAFCDALEEQKYVRNYRSDTSKNTYYVNGLDVYFRY